MSIVIRMPYGGGVHALEHHSESREAYFGHTPGLKTVIPSGPRDARALLLAAIEDPDPVVFMEPKLAYRSFREEVPDDPERLPIGQAFMHRSGDDLTMISYGAMLGRTLEAAETIAEQDGIEADVIDLRTISPMDEDTIIDSVNRTGHAVVVHEAPRSFGPGADIIARINDRAFYCLKKPVRRVAGFDLIMPFFARENDYLPDQARITAAVRELFDGQENGHG